MQVRQRAAPHLLRLLLGNGRGIVPWVGPLLLLLVVVVEPYAIARREILGFSERVEAGQQAVGVVSAKCTFGLTLSP